MELLESKINGEADIIFGGKIGACISSLKRYEPNVVIRIGELKEQIPVGVLDYTEKKEYKDGYQVNMIFNKVESIEVIQSWLEEAKKMLIEKIEKTESNEVH